MIARTGKRGEYTPQTLAIMAEGPKLRAKGMTYREIGARLGGMFGFPLLLAAQPGRTLAAFLLLS